MKLKLGQTYQVRAGEYLHTLSHTSNRILEGCEIFVVLSEPQEIRYLQPKMIETFYYVLHDGEVRRVYDRSDLQYIISRALIA